MVTDASLVWEGITLDGYILQLTHPKLLDFSTKLQSLLRLKKLAEVRFSELQHLIIHAIAKLVKSAFFTHILNNKYPVFSAQIADKNYQIVTQSLGKRHYSIIQIHYLPNTTIAELTSSTVHPNVRKSANALRREARKIFFNAYPKLKDKILEVHHRVPLEWRTLFPELDPNRLSNLQGLSQKVHKVKATDLWDAFRNAYRRKRCQPTPQEVLNYAKLVDRSLRLRLYL
jgi:hypothetical protein